MDWMWFLKAKANAGMLICEKVSVDKPSWERYMFGEEDNPDLEREVKDIIVPPYSPDRIKVIRNRGGCQVKTTPMNSVQFMFYPLEYEGVSLDYMYLDEDKFMGKGYAKEILKKMVVFSRNLGYKYIKLTTANIGSYTWARFGFNCGAPRLEKFKNDMIALIGYKNRISKFTHVAELAVIRMTEKQFSRTLNGRRFNSIPYSYGLNTDELRATFLKRDGLFFSGNYFLLGKCFFIQQIPEYASWAGALKFDDKMSMDIFRGYTGLQEDSEGEADDKFFRVMRRVSPEATTPFDEDEEEEK